ncbi:MAG: phage holin family protein [Puniceicoccaceae bacterium]
MAALPFFLRALATALGLGFSQWTSDSVSFTGAGSFLPAVLLLGLFATLLKPVLVLLMLPLVVLTLGVGLWVVNALLVMLTSALLPGFTLAGWGGAFWCALWVSLFSLGALALPGGPDTRFRRVVVRRRGFRPVSGDGGRKNEKKDDDVIDI